MWWYDPVKDVIYALFHKFLAPYVENLDAKQLNFGLTSGKLVLQNLKLKKEALDKFRLPVDVLEGYLGILTVYINWSQLFTKPFDVVIQDVYLLAVPASQTYVDPAEEEARAQAAKKERLESAELLHLRTQESVGEQSHAQRAAWITAITKSLVNLQLTIKNIHIRYEDKESCPEHPFAAGFTLAGFEAFSTNDNWEKAINNDLKARINKLAKLESFALYFDTDAPTLGGLPPEQAMKKFLSSIARDDYVPEHQFVLRPVTGEGRITINPIQDAQTAKFDAQLIFDTLGIAIDRDQYRDAISMIDMYHVYLRHRQYRKYRPTMAELEQNRPRALLRFASKAILSRVHEKNRSWSWAFFAERRDNRLKYVELFKQKLMATTVPPELSADLEKMEKTLAYQDIRFYRSMARSQFNKDMAHRREIEQANKPDQSNATGGWVGWLWGSSGAAPPKVQELKGELTDEQRRQLYTAMDYDEKAALTQSFEASSDTQRLHLHASLNQGSFALRNSPKGSKGGGDIIRVVYDSLASDVIQRVGNSEVSVSLGSFSVFDDTSLKSAYKQIVRVKKSSQLQSSKEPALPSASSFLYIKYENNPLDDRADNALTVRLRHMEIIYHRGYVEAIYRFFKPPESQLVSVEALLDAATSTLQSLRDTTRAGLEYALETHKTIDIQMDLNAPIIIVPESASSANCRYMVVDAGHISIESNLVDKKAVREIRMKRKQSYTPDDFRRLESLMYDKFTLKLDDAQFLVGNNLQSCMEALSNSSRITNLHLVEKISINLSIQNSIVPSTLSLARFKVAGTLPQLQVNFSDAKYKALMKFIDIAVPTFSDPNDVNVTPTSTAVNKDTALQLNPSFFGDSHEEYHVTTENNERKEAQTVVDYKQHIFELRFEVDKLQASLFKQVSDGAEKPLGSVTLRRFGLTIVRAMYDMEVGVSLNSLAVDILQDSESPLRLLSSESNAPGGADLMSVKYVNVQKTSPEFASTFHSIDQDVGILLSTVLFRVAPEPVIAVYDFIMSTFTTGGSGVKEEPLAESETEVATQPVNQSKQVQSIIRVAMKLDAIKMGLVNERQSIATFALSTADLSIMLVGNSMTVDGRLGNLSLTDDLSHMQDQILSIEGSNFAELKYQTFDPTSPSFNGINSKVDLRSAAVKVHFLAKPLQNLYRFAAKFARLKGLYDAATQAAAQRASEISRMKFFVSIESPIIVFPCETPATSDFLLMKLGRFTGQNEFTDESVSTTISLNGIHLESVFFEGENSSSLNIIEDVNINVIAEQSSQSGRSPDNMQPDTKVTVKLSDINLSVTQRQYSRLLNIASAIPLVFDLGPNQGLTANESARAGEQSANASSTTGLAPELTSGPAQSKTPTIDLVANVEAIQLKLYDARASSIADLKQHGVAQFALRQSCLRFKMLGDGALEAELVLKSFTVANTRLGNSKFREIIPAAQHERNQFMLLYTASGGGSGASMAILTVDSPQVIFAMDPLFALVDFFTSPALPGQAAATAAAITREPAAAPTTSDPLNGLNLRIDLHDVSISVLESDSDPATQAIQLNIRQLLMSQQGIFAVSLQKLGMSLVKMDQANDQVRFMDDLDLNLAMDSRNSMAEHRTNIEIDSKPIVFRASYRDIKLISSIANRAIELSSRSTSHVPTTGTKSLGVSTKRFGSRSHAADLQTLFSEAPHIIMSKEQLKASIEGFRLVLIGDIHELPIIHLESKPFDIQVKDWSGALHAATTLGLNINYWNLTNSHWEPLIDPWVFSIIASKEFANSGTSIALSSRERLDVNLSVTFAELAISMAQTWSTQSDRLLGKARGGDAPYRIRNLTGGPLNIWSDFDGSQSVNHAPAIKLPQGQSVDWRFDDWRTMREQTSATGHNSLGIQFVEKRWEQLRSVGVDTVGQFTYTLRPRTDKTSHRLLCDVTVQDNVKVVTLRSTYKLVNMTMYPVEVTIVDEKGQPVQSVEKLAPSQDYAIPIEAALTNRIRIQPDQGFKFKWSPPIQWEDLMSHPAQTIRCNHSDPNEAPFRFQIAVIFDPQDPVCQKYPKMTVELRAPLELENLLPYDIRYRIYDKDTDQNWTSYLRRGGRMPIHAVDLRHLILLNITIQDSVFRPSEFAIINTDRGSDFEVEKRIVTEDRKGRKLKLHLHYEKNLKAGGAFKLRIYCPYIVMNKTGLPFMMRWQKTGSPKDCAGDDDPVELSKPNPFMLSHPSEGKQFLINIDNKGWSEPLTFETHAAETELAIESKVQQSTVQLGLSWAEGEGKYKLTKIITIAPRFLIKNRTSKAIAYREHGVAPSARSAVAPGETAPLLSLRDQNRKLLTFATSGMNGKWSAPIDIEAIGRVHFRLNHTETTDQVSILLRAEIAMEGATIFVILSDEKSDWPFVIENRSDHRVVLSQADRPRPDGRPSSNPQYSVGPRSSFNYAWDNPAATDKKLRLNIGRQVRDIDLLEMGDLLPFKFQTANGSRVVSLDIRADGPTQILAITNYEEGRSLYKLRSPRATTPTRQDSVMGTEAFEAITEETASSIAISTDFEGIGVSLVNRDMLEVLYLSFSGFKFEYTNSPVAQTFTLSVEVLQLDNQLHEGLYPVVLQPTPVAKQMRKNGMPPCVQASIILLNDEEHGVVFVKYASVLLQAMTVQADEDFIFAVYELSKLKGVSWTEEEKEEHSTALELPTDIPEPTLRQSGQDIYFEVLELQPVQISLSFMRTERVSTDAKVSTRNPFAVVLNAVTMAVGNVNDATLRLNALGIKDVRLKAADLQERIVYHYRQDVLHQVYRVLGSADFLGNPVGLFNNVSSGVADIFYEPFNGVVMHGNKEIGIGIAKGAASFVKKTVFGFSDSVTKVTSSVGKGLSAATFDSEFQSRRRMAQRRNKPRHAIYGMTAGAEAFATSVASGVEGVLMKPIEGAEEEGAFGFLKGVGKGLVGAVTKPVVGVFDLASNVSEGIRNTTTVFDAPDRDRVRLPRAIPYDDVLKPYNHREALGQSWLWDLERGRYKNERYVAHLVMTSNETAVVLTRTRVLSIFTRKSNLDWELPFSHVSGVQIEDTGVRFADKAGREFDRFVRCPDKTTQGWFFSSVAKVVKAYNAQRRIEH